LEDVWNIAQRENRPKGFIVALALLTELAFAQSGPYPIGRVKIVIPFPPGNTTDIITRLIAPKLQERLGQPIVVENKAGGSGTYS
jgi:tripartite-type tricarboxylate transporter receptor subunit TctC